MIILKSYSDESGGFLFLVGIIFRWIDAMSFDLVKIINYEGILL